MSGISIQSVNIEDKNNIEFDANYAPTQDSLVVLGIETCSFIQHKNHALKFLQKKPTKETRRSIPANLSERLSYVRSFVCTPIKEQIFFLQENNINVLLWSFILSVIFEEIPYIYMVLFLSVYSPHEHFYASKMFPAAWGCSLQNILTGIFDLLYCADMISMLMDYAILGVVERLPWNRCDKHSYHIDGQPVKCYIAEDFFTLTKANGTQFTDNYYYELNGTYFQVSQILYVSEWTYDTNLIWIYYFITWFAVMLFHGQLFKKYLWKAIDIIVWLIFFVNFSTWLYIEIAFIRGTLENISLVKNKWEGDKFALLTHSTIIGVTVTAPPVLHLISARSQIPVQPERDSTIYALSRFFFDCFQIIVYFNLKKFCESKAGSSVQSDPESSYPMFYLWPIFFKNFSLGPFYEKSFFILSFVWDYVTFIITYHCLVEVVSCEWPKLKKWMIMSLLTVTSVICKTVLSHKTLFFLYAYSKIIAYMTELAVIHWLYPIDRFLEDIRFFYFEHRVTFLRKLSIKLLPYFSLISAAFVMSKFTEVYPELLRTSSPNIWPWLIPVLPIVFGAIYIIIKTICVRKQKWKVLIKPSPFWGPKEHLVRQFRKQYDSRDFIHSLGPRFLNRHMLKRAEAPNYRLGVQYAPDKWNTAAMPTTVYTTKVKFRTGSN